VSYRNLLILAIVALLTLFAPGATLPGGSTTVSYAAPRDDFLGQPLRTQLAPEIDRFSTTCDEFVDHLASFKRDVAEFKGKPLNGKQQSQLGVERNGLDQQLDSLRHSLNNIIQKLRDNNKFTPELDSFINVSLRDRGGNAAEALRFIKSRNGALNLLGSLGQLATTERNVIEKLELEGLSGGIARHHASPFVTDKDRFVCDLLAARLILRALALTDQPSDTNVFVRECSSAP
jgi:hypothetical protein